MSRHRNKHKQHNNPLQRLGKEIMATLNELLADIATIAKGNGADQTTKDAVTLLQTQMAANNAKLVANAADDAESKTINANQQILIEALIHQLQTSNPPVIPVVSGVSLTTGSVNGGETVTLTGTGFSGASAVKFGTVDATSFSVVSDTSITTVAPAQTAADVTISVITPAGTSIVGTPNLYIYS